MNREDTAVDMDANAKSPSPFQGSAFDKRFLRFSAKYGFRSLSRNKRRTLLTIATVMLSSGVTIVTSRYSTAAINLWAQAASDTGLGHAQIHAEGFLKDSETLSESLTFDENSPLMTKIAHDPAVAVVAPRLNFEGIISAGDQTRYFLGTAVHPELELKASPALFNPSRPGTLDRGEFINSREKTAIVIGRGLAEMLKLNLGDEVTLMTTTVTGGLNGVDAVVRGIIDVPLPSFSKRAIYLRLDYAQQLLRLPGRVTEVAVRLNEPDKAESWVNANRTFVAEQKLELKGWWEIDVIIRRIEMIWNSVVGLISLLLFMSSALSVLNIIFLLVAERTVEIGTMMAIGARARDIRILFCIEGAMIGLIGGIAGVFAGNAVVAVMGLVGIPLQSPFSSGVYMLYPQISTALSVTILAGSIVVCVIASLAPAQKAASVEPVKAFRGQI
jgi:putative ABC transport system permease protein